MKPFLTSLLTLLLAFPAFGQGWTLTGGSVNASAEAAAYRTIVIFGDMQEQSSGCASDPWPSANNRCDEWDTSLTWVENNKTAENIDLVLFVGDLINLGTRGFHMSDAGASVCDGTVQSEATCNARSDTIAACELTGGSAGCFAFGNPGSIENCHSCTATHTAIDAEWAAFEAATDRLEAAGIPYALVKGNHDNAGLSASSIEPEGWNQYYDDTKLESIDNGTTYDYLGADTHSDAEGDGHAWTVEIDGQDILIVAMPLGDNGYPANHSSSAETWARGVFDARPTTPGILLAHWYGRSEWPAFTTEIPNLFAVVTGHVYSDVRSELVDGHETDGIIRIGNDFSNNSPDDEDGDPQNDYITLLRLNLTDDEITVKYWSATGEAFLDASAYETATSRPGEIATTSFDIMPPAAYDLSAYSSQFNTVFGFTDAGWAWPDPPAIETTYSGNATDECTELQALVNATDGSEDGRRLILADSSYGSCSFTVGADDVWIEMSDSTVFTTGTLTITGDRVKVTGGTWGTAASGGGAINQDGNDVLIDNVNIHLSSTSGDWADAATTSFAIVNSDLTSEGVTFAVGNNNQTDWLIAGNYISGTFNDSTANAPVRFLDVDRVAFVENCIIARASASHAGLRFRGGSDDVLVAKNIIAAEGSYRSMFIQSDPGDSSDNIYFHDNDYYIGVTTFGRAAEITVETPHSLTNLVFNSDTLWTITGNGASSFSVLDNGSQSVSETITGEAYDEGTYTVPANETARRASCPYGADH